MIYIRSMRLIFLLLLSTYQFGCSTSDLEVKVVSADELLVDIKNNNYRPNPKSGNLCCGGI